MNKIQIPERNVVRIKEFCCEDDYLINRTKDAEPAGSLEKTVLNKAGNYLATPNDQSDYWVFVTQELDTIRTSRDVYEAVKGKFGEDAVVLNPQFSVEHVSEFLSKWKLIKTAKKFGYWSMRKTAGDGSGESAKRNVDMAIAIIQLFAELFLGLMAFVPESVMQQVITLDLMQNLSVSALRIFRIICGVLFAGILIKAVVGWVNRFKAAFQNMDIEIGDLDVESFRKFMECFSDHDFRFPKGFRGYNQEKLFLCTMSEYTEKERCALYRYWRTSTENQFWCIFQEVIHYEFPFKTEKVGKRSCMVYRTERLNQDQKRTIMDQVGMVRMYAPPENYGVDYFLKEEKQVHVSASEDITQAIEQFREMHPEFSGIDLWELMYLMSDLTKRMKIDLSIRQNRDAIFGFKSGKKPYLEVERSLEKAILFKSDTVVTDDELRKIPKAVNELRRVFSDWPFSAFTEDPHDRTSGYIQLSILKALSNGNKAGMRAVFLQIAERIIAEFKRKDEYPYQYRTREWVLILKYVATVFQKGNFRIFLPMVLHHLVWIFENDISDRPSQIWSDPAILKAARDNLFINYNSDALGLSGMDAVKDHYKIVRLAAQERNPEYNLEQSDRKPDSFDIVNLEARERIIYYNALTYLDEDAVIRLYEYLYDLYCGTVCDVKTMRFLNGTSLKSEIQRKYPGPDGKAQETNALLQTILEHMMKYMLGMYQDDQEVTAALEELKKAWELPENEKHGRMLFLLAKYELKGLSVVSLLLCMSAQLTGNKELTEKIYMDFGNDLFRLVFLTYHKTAISAFYHDDVVYLIRILCAYIRPTGILLSYLDWIVSFTLPRSVKKSVFLYQEKHKHIYAQQIQDCIGKIPRSEIEHFIAHIETSSILNSYSNGIYDALMESLQERFPDDASIDILVELLTMITKKRSTERFADYTAEEILKAVNDLDPKIVYLFFTNAILLDEGRFLDGCPVVAEKILQSNFEPMWIPVLQYLLFAADKKSAAYTQVGKTFIEALMCEAREDGMITRDVLIADELGKAVAYLHSLYQQDPGRFDFINTNVKNEIVGILGRNILQILMIEKQSEIRQRILDRNGIVVYLHFILGNSGMEYRSTKEYKELSEKDRNDYLTKNYMRIRPFPTGNHNWINKEYWDLVCLLLQGGSSLVSMENRYEWLLRMAEDCREIVIALKNHHVQGVTEEVLGMLSDYILMVKRLGQKPEDM